MPNALQSLRSTLSELTAQARRRSSLLKSKQKQDKDKQINSTTTSRRPSAESLAQASSNKDLDKKSEVVPSTFLQDFYETGDAVLGSVDEAALQQNIMETITCGSCFTKNRVPAGTVHFKCFRCGALAKVERNPKIVADRNQEAEMRNREDEELMQAIIESEVSHGRMLAGKNSVSPDQVEQDRIRSTSTSSSGLLDSTPPARPQPVSASALSQKLFQPEERGKTTAATTGPRGLFDDKNISTSLLTRDKQEQQEQRSTAGGSSGAYNAQNYSPSRPTAASQSQAREARGLFPSATTSATAASAAGTTRGTPDRQDTTHQSSSATRTNANTKHMSPLLRPENLADDRVYIEALEQKIKTLEVNSKFLEKELAQQDKNTEDAVAERDVATKELSAAVAEIEKLLKQNHEKDIVIKKLTKQLQQNETVSDAEILVTQLQDRVEELEAQLQSLGIDPVDKD
ncbi:unnamed protein product [Amoebophrya sp. A120]|nr:unnamed protein product [Amoebophrya sp. A120]|eukprot:GSA120T00000765001.1